MTIGEKIQEVLKEIKVIENKEYNLITISKEIWDSDYQGEPTIPLSVIEDIKAEITNKADDADKGCKISSDYYIREKLRTIAQTCDEVCKIIDRKVNEVKGDKE